MKKFRLNLNELKVESFETDTLKEGKGTVKGQCNANSTKPPSVYDPTCNSCGCAVSIINSCNDDCYFDPLTYHCEDPITENCLL